MRQQIANLIVSGASKNDILSISGLAEPALDEILKDQSFIKEVADLREEHQDLEIEKSYAKVEKKALKAVENNIDLYDPSQICKVLETVSRNRINRQTARNQNLPNNGHFANPTIGITVNLPTFLGNSQTLIDSKKQVIEIDGRNLAPLPVAQVHQLFKEIKESENEIDPIEADFAERKAEIAAGAVEGSTKERSLAVG